MPPPDPGPVAPGPAFSWKRGALHALLALGGVVLAGGVLAVAARPVDPFRFGQGIGRFAAVAGLIGLAASWLHQTGRRRLAWVTVAAVVALLVAAIVTVLVAGRPAPRQLPTLTAAEQQEPLRVADGTGPRLRQAALGFSIPHPGPAYLPLPAADLLELSRRWGDPSLRAWGWLDQSRGAVLVLGAIKGLQRREDLEGFRAGLAQSLRADGAGTIDSDELLWDSDRREARLTATVQGGVRLAARSALLQPGRGRAPLLVVLVAFTPEPGELDFVLDGLRTE
jgi:hypothetical protein